jgi:hypothetical protein
MGGHVFRFAMEESDRSTKAVLDVEIVVWNEEPKRHILFRKHYHLESGPSTKGTPEGFAEAMSGLVRELSGNLRRDLCAVRKDSSPPDGG